MRTFLYFTGLITAIFSVAYLTAFLLTLGWNWALCYLLYCVGLVLIGVIAHFVNDRYMEWEGDYYINEEAMKEVTHDLRKIVYGKH